MRVSFLPLVLACGCATDVASRAEVRGLQDSVQSLQRENAALERRIQTLESERAVTGQASVATSAPTAPAPASVPAAAAPPPASTAVDATLPALTVVKLKPKVAPPPPLDVSTPVQEPEAAVLDELEAQAAAASPPGSAEQEYQAGLEALRTGNVSGGIERLKRFAEAAPKNPKADDALYYAALGELGRGEVARAAKLLEQVVERYPAGDVVQDAMLKLGEARLRLHQPTEARAAYAQLVRTFPGTPAAAQAQARLSTLERNP